MVELLDIKYYMIGIVVMWFTSFSGIGKKQISSRPLQE